MLNDKQILELFERFDERALMETTAKYEMYCKTIAYTILGEESAAKECFREALHKSWTSCPPVGTKSLKSFMGRLTREIAFQYPEEEPKVANAAEIETIIRELDDCVETGYLGADKRDEDDGVVETLNDFLAFIPVSKRRLFMMRYWFGTPIRAIADRSGLSSDDVQTELAGIREALKETFREAKTVWPVDGKAFLLKCIGEIDDAYISEVESRVATVAKSESGTPGDFEDEEEAGGKASHPWRYRAIVGIVAGVLAVAGLFIASKWFMNREIPIDEEHFPDKAFREYVAKNIDLDEDGKLSTEERDEVYKIEIIQREPHQEYMNSDYWEILDEPIQIDTLTGVGYFPNLESLTCIGLNLKVLDVGDNIALEFLDCSGNQLTSLDVGSNKALEHLNCANNLLTELDVRSNKALRELNCSNNLIWELKFRKNEVLETLYCYNNLLSNMDVTPNKALKTLNCSNNKMTELDLSENSKLEVFSCTGSSLVELDLSGNPAMKWVECSGNQIHQLNVHENPLLEVLGCDDNELLELDLSQNTKLTSLSCENNSLTSLDLRSCADLAHLYMEGNQIRVLELNDPMINHLITLFD